MPIMRAPSGSYKTFKIPCSGEGIFVVVNTLLSGSGDATVSYWNGTSMGTLRTGTDIDISSITVQNGTATVIVYNLSGGYDPSTRVCFIPGDPLASN